MTKTKAKKERDRFRDGGVVFTCRSHYARVTTGFRDQSWINRTTTTGVLLEYLPFLCVSSLTDRHTRLWLPGSRAILSLFSFVCLSDTALWEAEAGLEVSLIKIDEQTRAQQTCAELPKNLSHFHLVLFRFNVHALSITKSQSYVFFLQRLYLVLLEFECPRTYKNGDKFNVLRCVVVMA